MMRDMGFPVVFLGALVFIVLIHLIFLKLLKTWTSGGRKVMDRIEGFKMYLSSAEQDRLDRMNPPEKTPELFEKYLPYGWLWTSSSVGQSSLQASSVWKDRPRLMSRPSWLSGELIRDFRAFSSSGFVTAFGSAPF